MKIGIQLYTLRDEAKKDFTGILEKVAVLGYDGVEFSGFDGISAELMREKLKETDLEVAGSHTPIEELENELEAVISYNKTIGNTNIVIPYYEFKDKEDYIRFAEKLEKLGRKLSSHGMTLFYHNHSHELKEYDGEYGFDILFNNVDYRYLKAEIDVGWVYAAGVDPVRYIEKYKGHLSLLHIKDIAGGELTEVGNGEIDIKAVVDRAKELGVEWLIVEQDDNIKPGVESARISFSNLKKMI